MLSTLLTIALTFNEIMASNVGMNMSPATNFDSWVEVYNPGDQAVNLSGFYLSDDPQQPLRWKMPSGVGSVPAKGFLVLWLGSNDIKATQAPFKLDCEGGAILLSDAQGQLVCRQDYPEALSRTSYARKTDGTGEWGWTAVPTPGATNATSQFAEQRLDAPVVDKGSQTFTGSIKVKVEIPEGCSLRYTTGGAVPTATTGMVNTTGEFTFSGTANVIFRLFRDGYLPSVPVTRSYIKTTNKYTIPVISIVGNSRYFTDNTWGIDCDGTNGKTGNGQSQRRNYNMAWERPVNFSYITPENEMAFNQDVEISVSGGWSRATTPRSFKLKSGKEFDGQNKLNYRFFPQKPYLRNKVLLLRNGGNDSWCRIKDPAVQTIIQRSGIDLDLQSYVPVIEYVNGAFRGVLNMREPNNKKFVASNFGYDDDRIDMWEMSADSNAYMMVGTADVMDRIYELGTKINTNGTYEELCQLLDIDEFTNYMAAELYLGSTDWPHNNIKAYRSWDDGRYRFVMFDMDFTFYTGTPFTTFRDDRWHTFNWLYDENRSIRGEVQLVTFFLNMLGHDEFRRKFIDTYCLMGGSVFDKDRCAAIIDELCDRVRPMMQLDGKNPDGSAGDLKNGFNTRMESMMTQMQQFSYMKLSGVAKQSVTLKADTEGARLYVNGLEVPYSEFRGRLFAPVTLRAEAPAGSRFLGWRTASTATKQLFPLATTWRYYDRGAQSGTSWRTTSFDDAAWSQATAPLGYGMDGVKTTISYGSNANNKYPTYYFRKTITLDQAPKSSDQFVLNYQVDDGFVVYVNGEEAARYNMPSGTITYNTFSTTYAEHTPLTGSLSLSPSLFRSGSNVIAVEVHNTNASSSDIYWAAELLTSMGTGDSDSYLSTEAEMELPTGNNLAITACFEALTAEERAQQGITPVRVNEVSAANGIYVNDYWKRNDWVELYNTTAEPIDVEGMYLSDNVNKPQKYQITRGESQASTVIPAYGHLIVWCDKLEPLSQLHASFKLAAEGGDVLLTAADGSWSDRLTYAEHKADQTVGRYPDGSSNVIVMNVPTIEKPNLTSTYATIVDQPLPMGIHSLTTDGSDLTVSYVLGELVVRSASAQNVRASVYALSGQLLDQQQSPLTAGTARFSLRHLATGCYVARVTDGRGHQQTLKFVVAD